MKMSVVLRGLPWLPIVFCGRPSWAAEPAAGAVVHSEVWRVSRKKGREVEYFKGHVRYEGTDARLSADEAIYDHADQRWRAKGRVRIQRVLSSGDLVDARGDRGSYNQETGSGRLSSQSEVIVKRTPRDGTAPDFASGKTLTWKKMGQEGTLSGRVRAWGPRLKAWAHSADYDRAKGSLTLNGGRPVAAKTPWKPGDWRGAVKADRIVATQPPEDGGGSPSGWTAAQQPQGASLKRLDADGRAVGWIFFPSTKELAPQR